MGLRSSNPHKVLKHRLARTFKCHAAHWMKPPRLAVLCRWPPAFGMRQKWPAEVWDQWAAGSRWKWWLSVGKLDWACCASNAWICALVSSGWASLCACCASPPGCKSHNKSQPSVRNLFLTSAASCCSHRALSVFDFFSSHFRTQTDLTNSPLCVTSQLTQRVSVMGFHSTFTVLSRLLFLNMYQDGWRGQLCQISPSIPQAARCKEIFPNSLFIPE